MKKRLFALLLALVLLLCAGCNASVSTTEPTVTEIENVGEWA